MTLPKITKEISIGQILTITGFVISVIVAASQLKGEVDEVRKDVDKSIEEHQTFVKKDEVDDLKRDVREIRRMVYYHVEKDGAFAPGSGFFSPAPDSTFKQPGRTNSNRRNP